MFIILAYRLFPALVLHPYWRTAVAMNLIGEKLLVTHIIAHHVRFDVAGIEVLRMAETGPLLCGRHSHCLLTNRSMSFWS